ncbi:MAG TPA: hypothetical protein VM658_12770 [bacterium]|nr:hypothetical protein [bacterium]
MEYADLFAQQEEAKQNLRAIFTTEVAYFGENNTFSPRFIDVAWSPEGQTRYAYFLPGDSIQPTLTMPWHLPEGLSPELNGHSFTAMAVSNIDCDPTPDVWTVDDSYHIKNVINDVYQ